MKKSIRDIQNWQGKRALVREDLNVPFNDKREITDDTRIRAAIPTLEYLAKQGAKVVVISHLGRPKGKVAEEFSLAPVAKRLQALMPTYRVHFTPQSISDSVEELIKEMPNGEIMVLENIRFEPGEEKNDEQLSQRLAKLGDVYVNDAFGTSHRAHSSTEGVAHFLTPKVAGFLMEKEINALSETLNSPQPLTAIIGGSKISTKITVLENLLPRVSNLVIGGGMLFTFLKAQSYNVGKSLVEEEFIGTAKSLLEQAQASGKQIILASDVVVADKFAADAASKIVSMDQIPADWMGLDIGPESIKAIQEVLKNSDIVLWNGPLGVFEFEQFANGTRTIAETIQELTKQGQLKSVLGGGDTVAAIEQFKMPADSFTHVSTGGGASLEFLEGKTLPGIAILDEATASCSV